ncbi:IS110 family transposase [Alicyclobacillus dauci]|uniref:IS110 family transposase n=1 Tax=Alicyclobacillus dauci TaxID=1475485 RepID=A0ABY6YX20_9BACL|nr:transposase [Alicyclobacillus dauci]WAH35123.1 IS110 family transposase [Alicyclobacillus dauci]
MPSPLFVGIDVSSEANVVCCLTRDDEKRPVSRFTVTNNRPGILEFQERITKLAKQLQSEEILFGLEHTGCFSTHAAMYLQRHLDFGVPRKVYVFNPSLIREFKKSHFLSAPKNDRVDAWFIAAKLRTGLLPHPFTWSEPLMALQRLTRTRYHLMQDLTRESNFLMTNLFLKFSDYTITGPFRRNKLSATSLAVMEEFESAEEIAEMSLDRLIDFLVEHGKNRFENPEAVAQALQKAARSSYRLPQSMSDSVNLAMASSIRMIRTAQEQLKALRKASRTTWRRSRKRSIPFPVSVPFSLLALWLNWTLASSRVTRKQQSMPGSLGQFTSPGSSQQTELDSFILATAISSTTWLKRPTASGCTTLFLPSTMPRRKRSRKNLPRDVPLRLQPGN